MEGSIEQERRAHAVLHRRIAELLAELATVPPTKRWRCEGCRQLRPLAGFRLCGCSLLCQGCAAAGTGVAPDACTVHETMQVGAAPR